MSYETELERLQNIITADSSTEKQREIARKAKEVLIDNEIDKKFARFEDRTRQFNALIRRLTAVVDKIAANELSSVIDTLDRIVTDAQEAAGDEKE